MTAGAGHVRHGLVKLIYSNQPSTVTSSGMNTGSSAQPSATEIRDVIVAILEELKDQITGGVSVTALRLAQTNELTLASNVPFHEVVNVEI